MTPSPKHHKELVAADKELDGYNRTWQFFGGSIRDIGVKGSFAIEPLAPPKPNEVIARVDAVCICSSDVKVIRLGFDHPLFVERDLAAEPVVLGHEIALTVVDVGREWTPRYRPGQRLGLQPSIIMDGKRLTVGFDLPGGLTQYLRLDETVLGREKAPYVFEVPDDISAATVALLEPYACVDAAFRKNSRTSLKNGGRLLIVGGPESDRHTLDAEVDIAEAVLVNPPPSLRAWACRHAEQVVEQAEIPADDDGFDDIIACGRHSSASLSVMFGLLNRGGLFALVATAPAGDPVAIDAARVHYHEIALVGANGPHVDDAFGDAQNRFELKPKGVALILGAGGAMGRIHVHRALELDPGPASVVVTSRQASRLKKLTADFAPLAARNGKRLVVVEDARLDEAVAEHAPHGVDDAVVVAPDIAAIERAVSFLAPGGMLVIFAGTPFGESCRLPLWRIATDGLRITGSTGCTVADQIDVLGRVRTGNLDLSGNLEAVAGLNAVPDALSAVADGRLHGKVVIYPNVLELPLTPISQIKGNMSNSERWTREDEKEIGVA